MPLDTSVKFFHSGMTGVGGPSTPSFFFVSQQSGNFAAVRLNNFTILDKILVSGFNSQTASGISVSNSVATVTFAGPHNFELDTVILVAGATPAGLNGQKRITSATATTLTFEADGIADGAATGTITARYAPFGWAYAGATPTTLPATWRSTDPTSSGMGVRMDMAIVSNITMPAIQIDGYRNADANGFSAFFGTRVWPVSLNSSVGGHFTNWIAVGDSKTVYILLNGNAIFSTAPNTSGFIYGFGDIAPIFTADQFRAFVSGTTDTANPYYSNASIPAPNLSLGFNQTSSQVSAIAMPGGYNGAPYTGSFHCMEYPLGDVYAGASAGPLSQQYPNAADSSLILARKAIGESAGIRGHLRGMYQSPQACATSFSPLDRVTGTGALSGRKLLAIRHGPMGTTTGTGVCFFDISGPWG